MSSSPTGARRKLRARVAFQLTLFGPPEALIGLLASQWGRLLPRGQRWFSHAACGGFLLAWAGEMRERGVSVASKLACYVGSRLHVGGLDVYRNFGA